MPTKADRDMSEWAKNPAYQRTIRKGMPAGHIGLPPTPSNRPACVKFFVPCIPPKSTHQASLRILKHGDKQFIGKMTTSKGKAVEHMLSAGFSPYVPAEPMQGPLYLKILYRFPWRKGQSKRSRAGRTFMWCDTRPDADNLEKLLMDVLSALNYFKDDAQVADLQIQKQWGEEPGIGIELRELK